jgi:glycopeptide antibiotics resistance protein
MHPSGLDTETPRHTSAPPAAGSSTPTPTQQRPRTPRARSLRSPAFAFFCAYALFVVYATLLPFQFLLDSSSLHAKRSWINWNPLVLVSGEPTPIADVVSNVALFVPLGFIAFHAQRRRRLHTTVLRATTAGLVLSAAVEVVQFFTPSRNPATSDVITNTLGAALGALLAAFFRLQIERQLRRRARAWTLRQPLLPVLVGYTLLVVVVSLVPFDLVPTVGWLKRALRAAQFDPRHGPMDWPGALNAALHYAVLTGLAVQVSARLHPGAALRRFPVCWVAASALGLALEMTQLLVRSHVFSTRDVLAAIAGAGLGGIVALGLGTASRARHGWTLAAIGYIACLAAQALSPFHFALDLESMRARLTSATLVPYSSYYYKATVAAVADFLDGMLAYAPLAYVLAQRRERGVATPREAIPVVVWCIVYALALEILQLGVPRRYPEVSDVLTAALGAALGAYAWRWFAHLGSSSTAKKGDGPASLRSRLGVEVETAAVAAPLAPTSPSSS